MNYLTQRKQAKILQECLDALADGTSIDEVLERYPQVAGTLRERLAAVAWLQHQRTLVEPRPEFIQRSHRQLVLGLEARMTQPHRIWRALVFRLRYARLAFQTAVLLLLCFSLFNVSHQTLLLSQRALPGDFLYPLKRSMERVKLAFTFGAERDARLNLFFTQQRTLELQELLLEGSYERIDLAVAAFQQQVQQTDRALKAVARRDPLLAQELQLQMSASLQEQAVVLILLVDGLPNNLRSGVEQVVLAVPH